MPRAGATAHPVRRWLTTYAGPLLGLTVVTALLVNLGAQQPRESTSGSAVGSASAEPATPTPRPAPKLFTVTPDFSGGAGTAAVPALTGQTSPPVTLRLANDVVVPVRAVGTGADGSLDVPDDIRVAGWWQGGARLGDPFGSMLIAAHVDSRTQGLGPYSVLLSVGPGARFTATGERGLTQTFAVSERRVVARDKLDTVPDIFSPRGKPRLTMVTCAGPYDRSRGGYQNLAVVTAEPVGPAVAPAG
ncbi:hypothetical protein GCM10011519_13540 [Marmoricola endophyticus]|uniref:Class F sortase n=1 Tax=Marmoricola endophyticus TaxID=2040280 RepID=A0A917BHB8_9ACTN|nr:class F sortase [Marmoricola endophyticus]GGF41105.1 hypothetical protein GCM10011519_13540 [Marmoricola endophyticus]